MVLQIDIFSDLVCPWCYIGKHRLEEALSLRPQMEATIFWHPFELNPDMPMEGMEANTYMIAKFGSAQRAKELYAPILEAAAALELPLDLDRRQRIPNTARSHALTFWAQQEGYGDAMVEALFRAYFAEGRDIGAASVLAEIAESVGMDRDLVEARLASGFNLEDVHRTSEKVRQMGLTGVPFFIINRTHALSGAQDSSVFLELFDKIERGEI